MIEIIHHRNGRLGCLIDRTLRPGEGESFGSWSRKPLSEEDPHGWDGKDFCLYWGGQEWDDIPMKDRVKLHASWWKDENGKWTFKFTGKAI
jgi:hypothetical protein